MKKIILGCAAVLLSLGLLAGCNNKKDEPPIEEAVVITVDSSASVVVGESLALTYTVSPAKAEVVAASDNQDIVTAVAQEGTLYLEGVAEGSAIVTLVGTYEGYASANKNINVSVITKEEEDTEPGVPETGGEDEPETTAVTLTLTTSTLSLTLPEQGGTAEAVKFDAYTVTPEGADVLGATEDNDIITVQNADDGCYITPVAEGEATVTLTAEYTSDEGVEYTPDSKELKVIVSEYTAPEPEPEPEFESYTLTITLYGSGNSLFPVATEGYGVYVQSAYDNWGNDTTDDGHAMTNNGDGTYTYVFYTLPAAGSYDTKIYAGDSDGISWNHVLGEFDLTVTGNETNEVVTKDVTCEYTSWEDMFPPLGSDTSFYIVLVDATSTSSFTESTYWHAGGTYFNNQNYCDGVVATTGSSKTCLYNGTVGIAPANTNDWFYVEWNSSSAERDTGYITIPATEAGQIAVYVASFNLTSSNTKEDAWDGSWSTTTSSITDYIATL